MQENICQYCGANCHGRCDGCKSAHEHSHEHSHNHNEKEGNLEIILLIISSALFLISFAIPKTAGIFTIIRVIIFATSVVLCGFDLFLDGLKELFHLKLEENTLLLIAVVAAFVLGEYPEACIVTILFKLGEILEEKAIAKSRKDMEGLTSIRPDFIITKNITGEFVETPAKDIAIGTEVFLRAGDKCAIDCEIIDGASEIDSSALTGESLPISVLPTDTILSGSINLSGLLHCKTIKTFDKSAASQIIDMVYSSTSKKGKAEKFISRFAKIYTPIVIALAFLIAVIPPLIGIGEWHDFIMRSLIFLMASCPCALVISVPLSFFSAIGGLSKLGVLVKGSMHVEQLAKTDIICLDKTGTITTGKLKIDKVISLTDKSADELLSITASMESGSTHPIATCIIEAAANLPRLSPISLTENAGLGITASINDEMFAVGGINMLKNMGIAPPEGIVANVYIVLQNAVIGYITLKEEVAQENLTLVEKLKSVGIKKVIMLTGDNEKSAKSIADLVNVDEFKAGLLPEEKAVAVTTLKENGNVAFVGDGINDAPVIASANLGISMGFGSEIANATSDIILSSGKLSVLSKAIKLAKKAIHIVNFNIWLAICVKVIVLILGAFGFAQVWLAVFADIGIMLIAVLNSLRARRL